MSNFQRLLKGAGPLATPDQISSVSLLHGDAQMRASIG